jgi:hypothetical protein
MHRNKKKSSNCLKYMKFLPGDGDGNVGGTFDFKPGLESET